MILHRLITLSRNALDFAEKLFFETESKLQIYPEIVKIYRYLEKLHLPGNHFTSIPRAIKMLSTLDYLDFGATNITTIGDCEFCGFTNLKSLNLNDNKNLTFIHENAFGNLQDKYLSNLCNISLLNSNLTILPEKLFNWDIINDVRFDIDRFNCNCSMAWLIKDVNTYTVAARKLSRHGTSYRSDFYCLNLMEHMIYIVEDVCNTTSEV